MTISLDALAALRQRLRGQIVQPDAAAYDELRRTFNAMLDRRPPLIVRPVGAGAVPTAVSWSRLEQAFGSASFARLQAVKRRMDPANRFRFNASIPPV
jgi:hypothetical protein